MDQRVRDALSRLALAALFGLIGAVALAIAAAAKSDEMIRTDVVSDVGSSVGGVCMLVALVLAVNGLWRLSQALGQSDDEPSS